MAYESLHSLSTHIDHEYAAVVSNCDVVGYTELAVIISETTEAGEDSILAESAK